MSYRFAAGEPVERGVRRMALEQLDRAIIEIDTRNLGDHDTIHQVRKRCKKVRALARLVRPALGDRFAEINAHFRELARPLSGIRDAHALVETIDGLVEDSAPGLDPAFASVREALVGHRDDLVARTDMGALLYETRVGLVAGRAAVDDWRVDGEGFAAIAGGLRKVYRRGRHAMVVAREAPTGANFHEWRKRVKYLWYHLRLIQVAWPGVISATRDETDRLASILGDDHDVHVMRMTVEANPSLLSVDAMKSCLELSSGRSDRLRETAALLGRRIYAEKSKHFVRRLAAYDSAGPSLQ